jgi:hypothetical protein
MKWEKVVLRYFLIKEKTIQYYTAHRYKLTQQTASQLQRITSSVTTLSLLASRILPCKKKSTKFTFETREANQNGIDRAQEGKDQNQDRLGQQSHSHLVHRQAGPTAPTSASLPTCTQSRFPSLSARQIKHTPSAPLNPALPTKLARRE